MKCIKKVLALMLIATLVMCSSVLTAFAADSDATGTNDIGFEEVAVFDMEDMNSATADSNAVFYEFSESNWVPAVGAYGAKKKATASGTMRFAIGAACRNPGGTHSNDKLKVTITSGLVTLATISVPVDGKVHVYRYNGSDLKKVNIVKGNNYTTKIEGPSNCLLMAISGYLGAE